MMRALEKAHKYGKIQVDWPYSEDNDGPSLLDTPTAPLGSTRHYTAQSEQDWWAVWEEPIKNCVLRGRQCWVTLEDWKDVVMGRLQIEIPLKTWGTSADDWATSLRASDWQEKQTSSQAMPSSGWPEDRVGIEKHAPGRSGRGLMQFLCDAHEIAL